MKAMKANFDAMCVMIMLKVQGFLKDEKGDTNFISILIILGIVILLAGVFIGFKDKIITQVNGIVNKFKIK